MGDFQQLLTKAADSLSLQENNRLIELWTRLMDDFDKADRENKSRMRAIREKCEQYWNEHNIGDAEIHAVLEFIHREAKGGE